MEKYVCPKAELIKINHEEIVTTSPGGCNCFADRWNESHATDSGCTGISVDYTEVMYSA